uniref:Reverse transcriptase domain-containing protein n=1 Tax=Tanacetum cinerariifolium TaxID=118510 RepID=A0A699HSS1_TANCI|nr:hypothetical protein [Tanacetum cinerariifolium]
MKRKRVRNQKESQICYGQFISKLARKCRVLIEDVVRSLSALIYYRDLDTTTLRDLIKSDGKLVPEDLQPGVPRVGIPRPPRASMQDLYDRIGRMEIFPEVEKEVKSQEVRVASVTTINCCFILGRHYNVVNDDDMKCRLTDHCTTRCQTGDQDGQGADRGIMENGGVDEVPDFSIVIAQQLQDLLPTIIAQVGNHTSNIQSDVRNVSVSNGQNGCLYKEFIACSPKDYDGKGVVVSYTHWIKKMESVQDMSGCEVNQKEDVKVLIRKEFCPNNEMQKLETEFWCHAMVEAGHTAYTDRFRELVRLVPHLVTPKKKRIERNGSLSKNTKTRGNGKESSRDGNVRDDNKRSRAGRAFASTTNPEPDNYSWGRVLSVVVLITIKQHARVRILLPNPEEKMRCLMCTKAEEQKLKDIVLVRNFPETKEEHETHLRLILELVKKKKLYVKYSKCGFWLQKVQFLRHVINDDGIHVDLKPMKILEQEFKKLKRSRIPIVKVRWNSKRGPEFTWEREDQMKLK